LADAGQQQMYVAAEPHTVVQVGPNCLNVGCMTQEACVAAAMAGEANVSRVSLAVVACGSNEARVPITASHHSTRSVTQACGRC
jgi:pyruvate/2-oxoglutarate dehydrogenase complex dihydrolipoamide dehydrogenase (E3) component